MKLNPFPLILISLLVILPQFTSTSEAFQREKFYSRRTKKNIDVVKGEVIVKYKSSAGKTLKANHARRINAVNKGGAEHLGVDVMELPENMSVESAVEYYKSLPEVEYAEPNYARHAFITPDDTLYNSYQWGVQRVDCPSAWDMIKASPSVIVAVVDTGVDYTHSDLAGNVDWANGYNFVSTFTANDHNPMDDNGHGTHVAGIISAMTNNNKGIAGVSWGARILPVKVLDATGSGSTVSISSGISYAVSKGAKIISLSLGGPDLSELEKDEIEAAYKRGCIIIAASGNEAGDSDTTDDYVMYPAAMTHVIAVGAAGKDNKRAPFSNYGPELDLVAPGVEIWSTVPTQLPTLPDGTDNTEGIFHPSGYAWSYGTSMATPFVSGVVALILAKDPALTFDDVYEKLTSSATDILPSGKDNETGYGLLNASGAVGYKVPAVQPTITAISTPNPFNPSQGQRAEVYLSKSLKGSSIKITIYNIAGEKIRTKTENIASHAEWDGRNDDGDIVANGIYLYVIETDLGKTKGKITLIK
ncbi:MAG: S8 family serine peptidase [Elusimicrobia bacterium]|nr:S8 family serine peptidase [Elusimicrobiota bacterium]MBU2614888.1 S8 family serine peptidase [Elusimicrobiota bacterium]